MTQRRRLFGLLFVGWTLACSGAVTAEDSDTDTDAVDDAPDEDDQGPETVPPLDGTAKLPKLQGDVAAWLAIGTRATNDGEDYWVPIHETAEVVLFAGDGAWDDVPPGSQFTGLTAKGEANLVFQGVHQSTYGCDGNTAKLALFDADRRPDGIVWLRATDDKAAMKAMSPEETSVSETQREWKLGPMQARLSRTSDMKATLTLGKGGKVGYKRTFEKYTMDGMDEIAIDLTSNSEVAMPYPELAVMLGKSGWLVYRSHGYEGTGWDVIGLSGGKGKDLGSWMSAYYCAF